MTVSEQSYDWAYDPGRRTATDYIILHHAAGSGSAQDIHRYHRDSRGWAGIAYHYYVRRDGTVWRGRPEDWTGGHTGGYNRVSIGLCFEGNFDLETMGPAQLRAGQALVAWLAERFPTAVVVKHGDLNATACPGRNFPLEGILRDPGDVEADAPGGWAREACDWCVAQGLFRGDADGSFRWQDNITRQELAALLHRLRAC